MKKIFFLLSFSPLLVYSGFNEVLDIMQQQIIELEAQRFVEFTSTPILISKNAFIETNLVSIGENKLTHQEAHAVVKERDGHLKNAYDLLVLMQNYSWYVPDLSARDLLQVPLYGAVGGITTRSAYGIIVGALAGAVGAVAVNFYDKYENLSRMKDQFAFEYNMYLMCCDILERNAVP